MRPYTQKRDPATDSSAGVRASSLSDADALLDLPPEPIQTNNPGCRLLAGLLVAACLVLVIVLAVFFRRHQAGVQSVIGTWQADTAPAAGVTGPTSLTLAPDGTYTGKLYVAPHQGAPMPRTAEVSGRWALVGGTVLLEQDRTMAFSYGYGTQDPSSLDIVTGTGGRHLRFVTAAGKTVTLTRRPRPAGQR